VDFQGGSRVKNVELVDSVQSSIAIPTHVSSPELLLKLRSRTTGSPRLSSARKNAPNYLPGFQKYIYQLNTGSLSTNTLAIDMPWLFERQGGHGGV
jgi:hypothetical protein